MIKEENIAALFPINFINKIGIKVKMQPKIAGTTLKM
jgi:hypothetical protein